MAAPTSSPLASALWRSSRARLARWPKPRIERYVAGAEANVAVGLARLGHGVVAYIGNVGSDGFGTAIVRALRGEGVDVRHLTSWRTGGQV